MPSASSTKFCLEKFELDAVMVFFFKFFWSGKELASRFFKNPSRNPIGIADGFSCILFNDAQNSKTVAFVIQEFRIHISYFSDWKIYFVYHFIKVFELKLYMAVLLF